jgi:hypothetical protein
MIMSPRKRSSDGILYLGGSDGKPMLVPIVVPGAEYAVLSTPEHMLGLLWSFPAKRIGCHWVGQFAEFIRQWPVEEKVVGKVQEVLIAGDVSNGAEADTQFVAGA